MFRIHVHHGTEATSFTVEGKLKGPWVNELERCWQTAIAEAPASAIVVDLTGTIFIDESGKQLLARMREQGVKLAGNGLMMEFINREIDNCRTNQDS